MPSPSRPALKPPAVDTEQTHRNSYASDKYGFSLQYPEEFGFDTDYNRVKGLAYIPVCDQNMAACAYISRDKYPGTNFDGAGVSVNIDQSLNSETKCYNFKVATNAAQNQVADVNINDVIFKSATGGDAGLGHSETVKVYRNFHNGMCYEIAARVGQTAIGNYPEGTVKPFDENQVWQKLQSVVSTFLFKDWLTYINPEATFSVQYPRTFKISNEAGTDVCEQTSPSEGCIVAKKGLAGISFGIATGLGYDTTEKGCAQSPANYFGFIANNPVEINGQIFYSAHDDKQTKDNWHYVYSVFHNGECYEADLIEFAGDENLRNDLRSILGTFKFDRIIKSY